MKQKILEEHRNKAAYIYIRQSTMGQVRYNQESTERQYALKDRAIELGWEPHLIKILDQDLGVSGAQIVEREDFKNLIADVLMGKVGAVFSLEASRLARSCADWHKLLELCAFTNTLIIDEDGCYNLTDFNDQLLMGLKGTMSQAELHFIRARLQGGRINKAQKGELRHPIPIGFLYDEEGNIIIDPDEEVYRAVRLLFDSFQESGSAYGVVHRFGKLKLKFPKRQYGGIWDGKLLWVGLSHSRVLDILKNPCYAGTYVYGRYQHKKVISPEGEIRKKIKELPISFWKVNIMEHHPGYISWEEYLLNQKKLAYNRTNGEENLLPGPAREGRCLLQGLVLCGNCGRKLTVHYKGNHGIYPTYQCNWLKREGLATRDCLIIRSNFLDAAICSRLLEVLKPKQIEIALRAMEELEQRNKAVDRQWQMKIERAEYETQLAQKRYEQVDPCNRLVASNLERRWNSALVKLEDLKTQYTEQHIKNTVAITDKEKERALSLAKNFPILWNSPSTSAKDKKRMLRLLIKDITVEKLSEAKKAILHIRWQGGTTEDISITIPPRVYDRYRAPKELLELIRDLARSKTDREIVNHLNEEGRKSPRGKIFNLSIIKGLRYRNGIKTTKLKQPDELTVKQISQKFGVSIHVVYYWIKLGIVEAHRQNPESIYWIRITPEKEKELCNRLRTSTKN